MNLQNGLGYLLLDYRYKLRDGYLIVIFPKEINIETDNQPGVMVTGEPLTSVIGLDL